MSNRACLYSLVLFISLSFIHNIQQVSGHHETVLGEMSMYGEVFIRSATGNWIPAPSSYPIVPGSEIRTGRGSVALYFNDGSRIDLSGATLVTLSSAKSVNSVYLTRGKLAINASPRSSFIFSSGAADIVIKRNSGRSEEISDARFLGIVSSDDKGIEVQSISGTAYVKSKASRTQTIPSGGSIFVSPDNKISTYETTQMNSRTKKCEKKKKPHKHCSPSTFYDEEYYCYYE